MANAANIKAKAKEFEAKVSEIMNDGEKTPADKKSALETIEKEWTSFETEVKNSERANELRAKLGSNAEGTAEQTVEAGVKAIGGALAAEILSHKGFEQAVAAVGGPDGLGARGHFRQAFEIGRKDATDGTAATNQMGEALYGGTGPTALGQNPFLAGPSGAGIMFHQVPGIVEQYFAQLPIESLFSSSPTESPAIRYLVESTFVNNAAEVAEGGQYPYSSDVWDDAYEQVGKIANAIKLTDENLQDAAQFASFVQGRMVLGIQRKKEIALLAGAGAPGVNGLLNRSTGFTQSGTAATVSNVKFPANSTPGAAVNQSTVASLRYGRVITGASGVGPTAYAIAEGIFSAITDITYNAFVTPSTILVNPVDWQTLRLARDDAGQYLGGSFFGADYGNAASGVESLWGKRVVVTPAIPASTILVGCFDADVANIFRRKGLSVEMTNSNGTDFDHGLVTVRGEERLALAVYRPAAFELIQLKNGA